MKRPKVELKMEPAVEGNGMKTKGEGCHELRRDRRGWCREVEVGF